MQLSTALEIKKITTPGRYSISGAEGLQLRVDARGKTYFFRYRVLGKRKSMSIGSTNIVSLAEAKQKTYEYQKMLYEGIDPAEERNKRLQQSLVEVAEEKAKVSEEMTFKFLASKFIKERAVNGYWKHNIKGERDTYNRMKNHVFPVIGKMNVNDIEPEHIRDLILPLWSRSPSTSSKVLSDVRAVLRWVIALRLRNKRENPADLQGSLGVLLEPYNKLKETSENYAAIDFREIPQFVKEISQLQSRSSEMLLLSIFLAARSKVIRNAKWSDIDLENRVWTVPLSDDKIKNQKVQSKIFLNNAAVNLLKSVVKFPESPYVFCNPYGRPYTDMAMTQLIRKAHVRKKLFDGIGWIDQEKTERTGKEAIATQHGTARATFRTWAKSDELGNNRKFDQEAVEMCLLHKRNDPYAGAYDRSDLINERRRIMEEWGKFCCSLMIK